MKTFAEFTLEQEYKYLVKLLKHTKGNIRQACKLSKIAPVHIYRMMRRNKIIVRDGPKFFGDAIVKGPEGHTIILRQL